MAVLLNMVDGKLVSPTVQPPQSPKSLVVTTIFFIVIPAIMFIVFLWFYISPLVKNKRTSNADAGTPNSTMNQHSLVTWMRRGSRGRFVDSKGNHGNAPRPQTNFGHFSLFARSSVIPHLLPASPPPAYATRPNTPTPDYGSLPAAPSSASPVHTNAGERVLTARSLSDQGRHIPVHPSGPPSPSPLSKSPSSATAMQTMLRPPMASRSVSESTLHPSSARLPVPSRALVYNRESPGKPNALVRGGGSTAPPGVILISRGRVGAPF